MTGLDTNVLVRYLTQDDPRQSRQANTLIDAAAARGERLQVDRVTLCGLVWVLRGAYEFDRATVATTLGRLLASAHFALDEGDLLREALDLYADGPGDFADYVMGLRALHALVGDRAPCVGIGQQGATIRLKTYSWRISS